MSKRVALEASHAAAEAVRMADVDVIAAYPITPQTHVPERLAEMVANGELDAAYIPVESEPLPRWARELSLPRQAKDWNSCMKLSMLLHP